MRMFLVIYFVDQYPTVARTPQDLNYVHACPRIGRGQLLGGPQPFFENKFVLVVVNTWDSKVKGRGSRQSSTRESQTQTMPWLSRLWLQGIARATTTLCLRTRRRTLATSCIIQGVGCRSMLLTHDHGTFLPRGVHLMTVSWLNQNPSSTCTRSSHSDSTWRCGKVRSHFQASICFMGARCLDGASRDGASLVGPRVVGAQG